MPIFALCQLVSHGAKELLVSSVGGRTREPMEHSPLPSKTAQSESVLLAHSVMLVAVEESQGILQSFGWDWGSEMS